jgi:hypothetical protein
LTVKYNHIEGVPEIMETCLENLEEIIAETSYDVLGLDSLEIDDLEGE